MEPKILYRAAVEYVPNEYYTIPLSKAEVIKPGSLSQGYMVRRSISSTLTPGIAFSTAEIAEEHR
jgi:pyruvate/2-oxoglutarate/acetoin dehydrogenase E1 component